MFYDEPILTTVHKIACIDQAASNKAQGPWFDTTSCAKYSLFLQLKVILYQATTIIHVCFYFRNTSLLHRILHVLKITQVDN